MNRIRKLAIALSDMASMMVSLAMITTFILFVYYLWVHFPMMAEWIRNH